MLEARFGLKNHIGFFPGAGNCQGKVLRQCRAGHLMVPLLPDSSSEFHESFAPSETAGPLVGERGHFKDSITCDVVFHAGSVGHLWLACLLHGPGPRARRARPCAWLQRPQAHQCWAGLRAHLPHAPAGRPHPGLRHLVVGPQQRVTPPHVLAGVIIIHVMPQRPWHASSVGGPAVHRLGPHVVLSDAWRQAAT